MKNQKQRNIRPTRKLLACALASSLMLGAAPSVFAQSSNATLRGHAPAGSQVTATNTQTGQSRRAGTSTDGSYALVGLPPGTYRVDAGPGTEQTVTLSVATSVNLDLVAAGNAPAGDATTLDTVTVTAPALTEVKTSEVGTNVSLKQINTVPQLTRNFLEFADSVPGMQFSTDAAGHSQIRGGAQQASAVNVYIDGVGQKSYLFGGVSGQEQSAGNPFPQLAIGEYKVITSNYKAEFDQVGSAAIVAQTKSGTNEFHGEVFGRHTDSGWRTDTAAEKAPGKEKQRTHQNEYGFALGGPIIQDKMHFFFSYEGKGFVIPADPVVPGRRVSLGDFLPEDVRAKFGPVTRPFKEDLYFGKIDWDVGDNDRLELSAKIRKEDSRDSVGGITTADAAKNNSNEESRYDLRWMHYGESYLNEARFTYEDVLFNPTAYTIGNQSIYTEGLDQNQAVIIDDATSGLAIQHKGQKGWGIQNDITFSSLQWHGDHVIKAGIKYKQLDLEQSENSTLNPTFYYAVNDGFLPVSPYTPIGTNGTPYQVNFRLPFDGVTPSIVTNDKQFGIYIQDDWDVNDRLQLNIGLRWDYEKIPSYEDYVTPASLVDVLMNGHSLYNNSQANIDAGIAGTQVPITYAEQLALGGVNIDDYISTGSNRKADKNNWAPRLGFSYDLSGDERHVLFGGVGRSYDRNLFDLMGLEQVKYGLAPYTIRFAESSGCTLTPGQCVNWDPSYLNGIDTLAGLVQNTALRGEPNMLNNNLETPYSDQISLGMRNSVGEWNTSAAVAYIHSKKGLVFTLGNRYPDGSFWGSPSWGGVGQPWEYAPPGFGGNLILANNGIETKTTQLLLSADKPYTKESGWGVSAAYTYSHARGNRGGDEHYAFDGETIDDFPFIALKAVPEHRLVMTGIYDLPWNITASAKVTLSTPPPLNEIVPGNEGHGVPAAIDGPGTLAVKQLDLSLSKDMLVTENVTVQVRGDLINALDADNFSGTQWSWNDGNPQTRYDRYGSQYSPPRTLFMSVRVIW